MNKRNYELTLNVTTGKIKIPSISIYNTDKGIFNIKLFLEKGEGKNIVKLTHDEMVNYKALFQAVKSKTKNYVELEGTLDETENFFYYDLGSKFNDQVGVYNCQIFITDTKGTNDSTTDDEVVTSVPFNYTVTASILTGLNAEITANPDLPVLQELINECKILMNLDSADMSVLDPFQKKEDDAIDGTDKNIISNINSINSQIKENIKLRRLNNDTTTKMIAHRGLSSKAPENTLPAYIEASKAGYWGGECDVVQTKDLNYVLFHDNTVDRMTNGTGNIKDMTLTQIKELVIDSGSNISSYPNLKIPTLDEFVSCCRANNLVPIIEIKWLHDYIHFINKIKELGMQNDCVFICFAKNVTEYIRQHFQQAKIQQLYNQGEINSTEINYCILNNFDLDCNYLDVNDDLIRECKANNIELNCWTVNDQFKTNELISKNLDYITTDLCKNEVVIDYKVNELIINKNNYKWNILSLYNKRANGEGSPFDSSFIADDNTRLICRDKFYVNDLNLNVEIVEGYKVTIMPYNIENKRINDIGWFTGSNVIELPQDTVYFILYWAKGDGSVFTTSDKVKCKNETLVNPVI